MDSSKSSKYSSNSRNSTNSNPSDHQRRNLQEANENDEPNPKRHLEKHSKTSIGSLGNKKKILAERNDGFSPDCDDKIFRRTPEASAVHLCSDSRSPAPYDPVINYTSPRPLFLRYNPNRGREILRRIEGELKNEKVSSELLLVSSDECVEDDDDEEEEEEVFEEKPQFIGMLWKSFLVIGVLLISTCYISWMNSGYLQFNGRHMRIQEAIFLNSSNMDVFGEGVDIKRVEDEILKVGIGEEINSGLLISEVKELHDFNEMAAGKENEISSEKEEELVSIEVMEKKAANSGLCVSEVKEVHDFNGMAAGKENEISSEKEEEIVSIEVMEKKDVNSGLLISEVKEVHDFNEMVAEKEEQETLPLMENEISSEKEEIVSIEVMEKKDGLGEFGQDSHNQLVSLMPSADGNPEERQLPAISSNSEMVLNDANLLLLLLTTFSAVLVGLLVYLCRRPKSGSAAVPIEIEAKITDPNATLQIEKDNVSAVKLEHKHKEFHGSRPPIVELIGEFSLDKLDSKEVEDLQMVQYQRKKVMKKPLTSADKIYQSPSMKSSAAAESTTTPIVELLGEFSLDKLDSKGGEDLQMIQYQRKKVMKKPLTSADKIYQSPSMKSLAAAESTTTPEKPLRKEDEEEINKGVSRTPLRRSNRIRNRNASPLNS